MLFLLIPFILYLSILLFFSISNIIFKSLSLTNNADFGISVIVAIRNGENSLNNLIFNLSSQDYRGPIEFILVDDESTDQTKKIILDIAKKDSRFRYVSSIDGDQNLTLKKKALDIGIQKSKYDYLLFTDVDCSMHCSWVSTMANYFYLGFEYLVGYSLTQKSNIYNFVSSFQEMDLFILMVMCRGSSYFTRPWACSGQNQGFSKTLYNKVGGFKSIRKFIGDDTAFLQLCRNKSANITFVDQHSACILSRQETNIFSFLFQRARWAFDANQIWRINARFYSILIITFLAYLIIPLFIFSSIFSLNLIIYLIASKLLLEWMLVYIGSIRYSKKIYWIDFVIWELFHIPYIILVGIMSFFGRQIKWKNRNISI